MKTRNQKIRLGIFIVVSASVLVFLIIYFTARQLFEKTDTYYVEYRNISVNGMEVGSSVKYLGIKVGTISDIQINPRDITSVVVELQLQHDTPIKEDSRADIISLGITGLKAVEILGGSNESDVLAPGDTIEAGSSITSDITQMAEVIAAKTDSVIRNLQAFTQPDNLNKITDAAEKIGKMIDNADRVISNFDAILGENRDDLRQTTISTRQLSETLLASSQTLERTIATINQHVESDTITDILNNVRDITQKLRDANIEQLVTSIANIANYTQQLLVRLDDDINKGSEGIVESQTMLKSILRNLEQATQQINQNPAVLIRGTNRKNSPDHQLKNK